MFDEAEMERAWQSALNHLRERGEDVDAISKQAAENLAHYHDNPVPFPTDPAEVDELVRWVMGDGL